MEAASSSSIPGTRPASPDARPAHPSHGGGVKETIESILIAFILAFVFRAFIVEAFVIPTGSMAPTLLGAHMRFHCEDCGYDFTVNYSSRQEGEDVNIPRFADPVLEPAFDRYNRPIVDANGRQLSTPRPKVYNIRCPNCGFRIGEEEFSRPGHEPGAPPQAVTSPPVHYGDRILVLKYQYLFQDPKRWDVVVFKSPDDYPKYQQNFIKRLVGKPGESLMILDGDIFTADDPAATKPDQFHIQTKPYVAQEALWRVVYDNDYHPRQIPRAGDNNKWVQPWTKAPGSDGWDLGNGLPSERAFRFDNPAGAGAIYFNASANPFYTAQGVAQPHTFTDWVGYDVTMYQGPESRANTFDSEVNGGSGAVVTDLKLKFIYERQDGSGPLRLQMTKLDKTFVAELTPDGARLLMKSTGGTETPIGQPFKFAAGRAPVRVEFTNVDYRVSLRLDGREVLATTPDDYRPDVRALLTAYEEMHPTPPPSVQIAADSQKCTLTHVSLWRDVYYINRGNQLRRGVPIEFPERLVHLKKEPAEYFVLGDNSIISGDGRYWGRPINLPDEDLATDQGLVPERFLLGKAFFVYWPAGFRPIPSAPGVIPNFGEMRFIH
jgi:signal peptidase I